MYIPAMNLSDFMPQHDVIDALAHRVKQRYPLKGACAYIAKDLAKELRARGISAKHVVGNFHLDEPGAFEYVAPLDELTDEYTVNHDWVEVEGRIIDASASQFKKYVHEDIPEVVIADYKHPLFTKYDPQKYG